MLNLLCHVAISQQKNGYKTMKIDEQDSEINASLQGVHQQMKWGWKRQSGNLS